MSGMSKKTKLLTLGFLVCAWPVAAQTSIMRTVAGGGPDGVPGGQASFSQTGAVTVGPDGTVYFTARGTHRVFAMNTSGEVRPVAGSGVKGFTGDGGPALTASLNDPFGVAVDAAGNLYISDAENHRIRRVDAATGNISTIAGTGSGRYTGDGGQAAAATLYRPYGLAFDVNGNLFVADSTNNVIRRIAPDGVITTVAGNNRGAYAGDGGPATSASLNSPYGIAFDSAGAMYIADRSNHRIRKVAPDGTISTYLGVGSSSFRGDGGPAAQAGISEPYAVAVDSAGNLYVADNGNRRIRKAAPNGGTVSTIAGNGNLSPVADGGPANATPTTAHGVAVDSVGNVYIADGQNNRLRKVDASTQRISTAAGNGQPAYSGDAGDATRAVLNGPTGLATDGKSLFIADTENHRIRKLDLETGKISLYAGTGEGNFSGDNGPATAARLNRPIGLSLDPQGNLYFADYRNHRIRKITPSGVITTVAGSGSGGTGADNVPATQSALYDPIDVAADASGNFYIADRYNYKIRKVSANGTIETIAGTGSGSTTPADGSAAKESRIGYPMSVAVDASGNVFFSDNSNRRVMRITDGKLYVAAGGGGSQSNIGDGGAATSAYLGSPQLLALDNAGSLLIADSFGHRVRRRNSDGTMSSVAGTGTAGFTGDGPAATEKQLNAPSGVAFVAPCTVYVADTANNRIRLVRPLLSYNINTVPAGLQLTVDGETGVASIARQWEATTVHTIAIPTPQEGEEGVRYLGPETQYVTVPCGPENQEINIGFQTQYRLTVEATEGGKLDVQTGWHNADAEVKVIPAPAEGFVFQGWEGACAEKGADECVVKMDAPKSVKALFAPAG
jgi:sugar lactone lactonase YvrE